MDTNGDGIPSEWTATDDRLYIYSEADISGIRGDMFVQFRDVLGDDDLAAELVEIVDRTLTDEFYSHNG